MASKTGLMVLPTKEVTSKAIEMVMGFGVQRTAKNSIKVITNSIENMAMASMIGEMAQYIVETISRMCEQAMANYSRTERKSMKGNGMIPSYSNTNTTYLLQKKASLSPPRWTSVVPEHRW
jgi:hypothetical protein